jgi:hypothetical protein
MLHTNIVPAFPFDSLVVPHLRGLRKQPEVIRYNSNSEVNHEVSTSFVPHEQGRYNDYKTRHHDHSIRHRNQPSPDKGKPEPPAAKHKVQQPETWEFDYDDEQTKNNKKIVGTNPNLTPDSATKSENTILLPTSHFYYTFAGAKAYHWSLPESVASGIVKSMMADQPWEHARFLIERKNGFLHVSPKKTATACYVVAYFYDPTTQQTGEQVSKSYVLKPDDKLVLVRKPLERGQLCYVPAKYEAEMLRLRKRFLSDEQRKSEELYERFLQDKQRQAQAIFDSTMSEDDKMNALAEAATKLPHQSLPTRPTHFAEHHPADKEKSEEQPQQSWSASFKCNRCHQLGHVSLHCPQKTNTDKIASIPKLACGIPKSMLKLAVTEEEKQNAMLSPEGQLVVLKKENKFQKNAWQRHNQQRTSSDDEEMESTEADAAVKSGISTDGDGTIEFEVCVVKNWAEADEE